MYKSFILPCVEYGNVIWGGTFDSDICKLERVHIEAMRLITGATAKSSISRLYVETGFQDIKTRCENAILLMFFKIKGGNCPSYLSGLLPPNVGETTYYTLRNRDNTKTLYTRLELFCKSFFPTTKLPVE